MAAVWGHLTIDTAGTEEETVDQLEVALKMDIEEARGMRVILYNTIERRSP